MKPTPMYRNIVLSEEINGQSVEKAINTILSINYDDDQKEQEYKDWVREPIYIFINSNGGNAYDAFALGDIIQDSTTPVYTVALGWCMSAGFLIFLFGHKRLIGPYATLMYHDIATYAAGKTAYLKQELTEAKRLMILFDDLIVYSSKINRKALEDFQEKKSEWYIPAKTAIELGLAHDYFRHSTTPLI